MDDKFEELIQNLKDENPIVRAEAAKALGETGDKKAVKALIEALEDGYLCVRNAATDALVKIGESAVDALIEALDKGASDACKIRERMCCGGIDPDVRVRVNAARALGEIGNRKATTQLIKALRNENLYVRTAAADALGKLKDPEAVDALIDALKDEYPRVRNAVVDALGKIGNPRAVDALIKALEYGEWCVRASAAKALGEIGDKKAVKVLIEALGDEKWYVRTNAAWALGKLEDPIAIPALLEASEKDTDPGVRETATIALKQIQHAQALKRSVGGGSRNNGSGVQYSLDFQNPLPIYFTKISPSTTHTHNPVPRKEIAKKVIM